MELEMEHLRNVRSRYAKKPDAAAYVRDTHCVARVASVVEYPGRVPSAEPSRVSSIGAIACGIIKLTILGT